MITTVLIEAIDITLVPVLIQGPVNLDLILDNLVAMGFFGVGLGAGIGIERRRGCGARAMTKTRIRIRI
ncbi:hypothetical protein ACFX2A_000165 [Malus domestica]